MHRKVVKLFKEAVLVRGIQIIGGDTMLYLCTRIFRAFSCYLKKFESSYFCLQINNQPNYKGKENVIQC